MLRNYLFILSFFKSFLIFSQDEINIVGSVVDDLTRDPIVNPEVYIENSTVKAKTNTRGEFIISGIAPGDYILLIGMQGYKSKKISISVTNITLDLGAISLEMDIIQDASANLIQLTENDLSDGSEAENASGLLQSSRDVFLTRAAFDFGQVFFKVRGYDSNLGNVLINGIPMNKLFNGRPQWNNWGGLNDVTRNQEFTSGLYPSEYSFGGILGTTNISMRASAYRKGLRVSSSLSNRSYFGRIMATYNSGLTNSNFAYSISASRRWAKEGFIDGTFYDSYSFFGALEYVFGKHSLNAIAIYTPNKRGQSSAITKEVFELVGRTYNPYWGYQNGKIRNSRVREVSEPIAMLTHYFEGEKLRLTSSIAYQFGKYARSRLGYYNAPNPDPVYYRYLPSFYINSSGAANFENANMAEEAFLENSQLDWASVYNANQNPLNNGKSAYVLYNDRTDDTQLTLSSIANFSLSNSIKVDAGVHFKNLSSDNYALIDDLLGAGFHEDTDPFSNTRNDLNSDPEKKGGDRFNYNYLIEAVKTEAFAQIMVTKNNWDAFLSGSLTNTNYFREGKFLNERFQENSFGKSEEIKFSDYGIKAGLNYRISGRHFLNIHGAYLTKAPSIQNTFINPRENNETVNNIVSETIVTGDVSYILKLPGLDLRLTSYYSRFQDATDINFFFTQGGVGSDFVQEVVTGIDKLHMGNELGLVYQASPTVKLSAVASYGEFKYNDDANVSINFDTAGDEEDLINLDGFMDLGTASIKGYRLANGPQKAFSIGVEYRDPKYWWISTTANYLTDNYIDISTIARTQSFYVNPDDPDGGVFPDATEEAVSELLKQEKLEDVYLLNLVGGKSWLVNDIYIGLFASVNNIFNVTYRSGGYEQSRNGNFGQLSEDIFRGAPSFGSKYWYGYGRTFFLNLSVNF